MSSHQVLSNGGPLLLKVNEVAELLNLSTRTVWRLTSIGELPSPISFGRSRRWVRITIEQYVAKKEKDAAA